MNEFLGKADSGINIGNWTNAKNVVTWAAKLSRAGKYRVKLDYACPQDSQGSTYVLSLGSQKISGKVTATGHDWVAFTTKELGTVELSAGRVDIKVTPRSKPGLAVMNLRSITLVPAN